MTTMCLKPLKAFFELAAGVLDAAVAVEVVARAPTRSAATESSAPTADVRMVRDCRRIPTSSRARAVAGPAGTLRPLCPRDQPPGPTTSRDARLLDGDGLREVAVLVDVVAAHGGHLAGEDLQRDGREQRLEQGGRLRHADHHVGVRLDIGIALLGD